MPPKQAKKVAAAVKTGDVDEYNCRLEQKEGTSNKFYHLYIRNNNGSYELIARWGRIEATNP